MMRARYMAWASVCLTVGCGGAQAHPETPSRASTPSAAQRALAPDLASRVDQATNAARVAAHDGDDEAQRDHEEIARLWQVALAAEAERIGLDRQRAGVLLEIETLETARIADDAARAAVEQTIRRDQAATVARTEAARVLSEAEPDEARRRGGDAARVDARREAARALLDRSAAIVAAAIALGATPTATDAATRAINVAREKIDGSAANMNAAQRAFALAQAALGEARAKQAGPSVEEHASLFEALATLGVRAEATDDGIVIWLADAFANGRAELKPASKVLLEALAAVLASHPHGPVQAHAIASPAFSRPMLKRRTQQVQGALRTTLAERVGVIEAQGSGDHDNLIRIVLPAYGCIGLASAEACAARPNGAHAQAAP